MGKLIRWITIMIMYLKGYEVIKCVNCDHEIFVNILRLGYTCPSCDFTAEWR